MAGNPYLFKIEDWIILVLFYFIQVGDAMKLSDHLSKQQRDNLNKIKKKKKEKVNWPEIMGMNRDTYKRVNGAIRRK